jgi:sulfhydrogenase subunit beta (sulfur reductase)
MYRKLPNENVYKLIESFKQYGKVYGPVNISGSTCDYKEINSPNEIDLKYIRTMIPPKKFFVQTKEKLFDFDEEKAVYKPSMDKAEKIILFGIHPCDFNALKLLDRIYLDENPDPYYLMRRKNTILVGVNCHPDEYCFCKSTGTSFVNDGFDLFLHEINGGYFVRIGKEKGYKIINSNKSLFNEVEFDDIKEFKTNEGKHLRSFNLDLNVHGLQDMLDLSYDDSVWNEIADKCLGCGTCNLTCPTCRCYDVSDFVGLDLKTGERVRRWDSCMLKKHGLVAGGLNFRPTRLERLQNRFNCKGSLNEGFFNCVGCGRCTVYCPADIDFVETMKKVRGES